jgi:hypothetical protein
LKFQRISCKISLAVFFIEFVFWTVEMAKIYISSTYEDLKKEREWCNDWYDSGYYNKSPERNPQGLVSGTVRVLRGGSWGNNAKYLRCAERRDGRPSVRDYYVGFRLCQDNKETLE